MNFFYENIIFIIIGARLRFLRVYIFWNVNFLFDTIILLRFLIEFEEIARYRSSLRSFFSLSGYCHSFGSDSSWWWSLERWAAVSGCSSYRLLFARLKAPRVCSNMNCMLAHTVRSVRLSVHSNDSSWQPHLNNFQQSEDIHNISCRFFAPPRCLWSMNEGILFHSIHLNGKWPQSVNIIHSHRAVCQRRREKKKFRVYFFLSPFLLFCFFFCSFEIAFYRNKFPLYPSSYSWSFLSNFLLSLFFFFSWCIIPNYSFV